MLIYRRVTPSIKFAGTHLYTWVQRDTVRVKCLAQEHIAMSLPGLEGVERTNHEAIAAHKPELYTVVVYISSLGGLL